MAYYLSQALNLSIKNLFHLSSGFLWSAISNAFMVLIAAAMLSVLRAVLRRSSALVLLAELLFLLLYGISSLQGNLAADYFISNGFQTMGICIPLAAYVSAIEDRQVFLDGMERLSYGIGAVLLLVLVLRVGLGEEDTYSMSASYALLLPILFQYNAYFVRGSRAGLAAGVTGSVAILLFGARGPCLCILLFVVLQLLSGYSGSVKQILLTAGAVMAAFLAVAGWGMISGFVSDTLIRCGIYSRTLELFLSGGMNDLLYSSGRTMLKGHYWSLILEKPLFGWGISGGWISSELYPHNIFLECLLSFGLPLGGIVSAIFLSFYLKPFLLLRRAPGSPEKQLISIYCAACVGLILSGSFLQSINWFIFMGLCLGRVRKKNKGAAMEAGAYEKEHI